jgi:hypothetical protein
MPNANQIDHISDNLGNAIFTTYAHHMQWEREKPVEGRSEYDRREEALTSIAANLDLAYRGQSCPRCRPRWTISPACQLWRCSQPPTLSCWSSWCSCGLSLWSLRMPRPMPPYADEANARKTYYPAKAVGATLAQGRHFLDETLV